MIFKSNVVMAMDSKNAQRFNSDYDGDNLTCSAIHSEQAKQDSILMFPQNNHIFDHNDNLVDAPEHEAIYAAFMLTYYAYLDHDLLSNEIWKTYDNLEDFEVNINDILNNYNKIIYIKNLDIKLPYNIVYINYVIGLGKIIYTGGEDNLLNKKNLIKLLRHIYDLTCSSNFYEYLHKINLEFLSCSTLIGYCNPSFKLLDFSIHDKSITDYKKTLINEPYIAFHQNNILFEEIVYPVLKRDKENILFLVAISGARIKSVQLLKAMSNNGIPTDIYGKAFNENIKESLLDGLTEEDFFMTGDSARLALAQRQESIPKGGELQRKLFFATGFLLLDHQYEDCGNNKPFYVFIEDQHHLNSLKDRYYFKDGKEVLIDTNDKSLIQTEIALRSPMYCKHKDYQICKKCFGKKLPITSNLGSLIGSYVAESIIQSVLRTHHFSGAFITNINKKLTTLIKELKFESPNFVIGNDSKIEELKTLMITEYYKPESIEFKKLKNNKYEIIVNDLPFNDDSVKQLQMITSYIDKNRQGDEVITPEKIYEFLKMEIIEPNNILSIYVELILSILFYDEDGMMIRYSDKNIDKQIALKNVIDHLAPQLSIFYNFSNKAISKIFLNKKDMNKINHMYFDLTDIYK